LRTQHNPLYYNDLNANWNLLTQQLKFIWIVKGKKINSIVF